MKSNNSLTPQSPPPCRGRAREGVETFDRLNSTPILTFPLQGGRNWFAYVEQYGFIEIQSLIKIFFAVLLLLGVASIGYWIGNQRASSTQTGTSNTGERKVLYYSNPMGLADTSPVPKKDSMGMDYVAVYEGEEQSTTSINISLDKVQKLGVKSEAAALRELNGSLRVTGRIEIDERRTYTIAPKFEGWVERLHVNTTGQLVTKGQALFDVYSPELVSAQREQTLVAQGLVAMKDADEEAKRSMQRLADATATRLKNWDVSSAKLNGNRITYHAKESGIVLEKKAVQGMRFMQGEVLYQIADLSSVWVVAEVPEQDIAQLQLGSTAQIKVDAYPERVFDGKVDFIYPTLNSATRTVQVRMQVANPKTLLKPAMFANATIAVGKGNKVLAVPTSAVIDSGTKQVVLVRLAEGRFEPRTVSLGNRSNDYVEVLIGIAEGEQVVTSANFLIDSESNLKAALGSMSEAPTKPQPTQKTVGHQAQGVLEAINNDGSISIAHQPIKSLGWPGMTMDFALANTALVSGIKPGSKIDFEIVERGKDEWVITKLSSTTQEANHAQHHH
ncbi:MAG: efflux RND transporter periplasmic adaptor subunit [Sideroxydans sp.]|nr:efflux RND transporter periplasmic adaptor subunit [Sideroxydans sp.]